jgi:hypothetical protein
MAEIFGIIAGIGGVADVGIRASSRLRSAITTWKHAPDDILALSREISDVNAILFKTRDACEVLKTAPSVSDSFLAVLEQNVEKAGVLLGEIDTAVQAAAEASKLKQRIRWPRLRSPLGGKREKLHDIRVQIRDLLHTHNM